MSPSLRRTTLIVRTSVPTRVIDDELGLSAEIDRRHRRRFSVLVGVGLMALFARRLARPITELTDQARAVAEGDVDVTPRRSRVEELDQLGCGHLDDGERLGARVSDAEQAMRPSNWCWARCPKGRSWWMRRTASSTSTRQWAGSWGRCRRRSRPSRLCSSRTPSEKRGRPRRRRPASSTTEARRAVCVVWPPRSRSMTACCSSWSTSPSGSGPTRSGATSSPTRHTS